MICYFIVYLNCELELKAWANSLNDLTAVVRKQHFNPSATFDSTKLHKSPGIQSQAEPAFVTMDTDSAYVHAQLCRKRRANSTFAITKKNVE